MSETNNPDLRGARVLLVDDQPANLDVLCELLEAAQYHISMVPSGSLALKIAAQSQPDLILLDVVMPEMDGHEVCRRLKADDKTQAIPVIFITGQDLKEDILAGFQVGGVDYITKPFQDEEVLVRVQTHVRLHRLALELAAKNDELERQFRALQEETAQRRQLKGQLTALTQREAQQWGLEGFIGNSPTIQRIFQEIRLMQENTAPSVLITGESGTGKELIARAIHFGGPRKEAPFVPVNCAALPGELIESLLFGHVKGAFTGADSDQEGHFQMAHGGTLFLDEIGEMPLELQAKLLRVLEDGRVRPVGATQEKEVDVRVLAATNVELQEQIGAGVFRQDLYFRLARFVVVSPPLRQRREDIPLLTGHFLSRFAAEMGREAPDLEPGVLEALTAYDFPGNVRELKNVIERALIESGGGPIETTHLHFLPQAGGGAPSAPAAPPPELPLNLDRAELWVIKRAIARCQGNISEAARLLGTHRNRIYRALAQAEERGDYDQRA